MSFVIGHVSHDGQRAASVSSWGHPLVPQRPRAVYGVGAAWGDALNMTWQDTGSKYRFAMLSDVGRVRRGNEDFCAAAPEQGLFVVCDGMGGAAAGEVASHLAATAFLDHLKVAMSDTQPMETRLQEAVEAANTEVRRRARQDAALRGMGTTLVAAVVADHAEGGRCLWLVHVGDSRCYRLRGGALQMLTQDHSLVQEQIMAGQITVEQADRSPIRNIITRAIGSAPKVQAEIRRVAVEAGDVYLLASDGLSRELPDEQIGRLLEEPEASLEARCAALVAAANLAGGHDNITVLLLRIDEETEAAP